MIIKFTHIFFILDDIGEISDCSCVEHLLHDWSSGDYLCDVGRTSDVWRTSHQFKDTMDVAFLSKRFLKILQFEPKVMESAHFGNFFQLVAN